MFLLLFLLLLLRIVCGLRDDPASSGEEEKSEDEGLLLVDNDGVSRWGMRFIVVGLMGWGEVKNSGIKICACVSSDRMHTIFL